MKKKIILLAIVTSLCLSGGLSFISTGQAATHEKAQGSSQKANEKELKAAKSAAIRDTKEEIGMIKSEIRTLESNLSAAKRALAKARQSEVEQREKCDELERKLSAKKTVYKLAETRIASGNTRAADGQAALALEINELEKEYTEALEQWELDKMVANDSSVVIDINKNLISQYQKRQTESEKMVDDIRANRNVDTHLQKIQNKKAAAEPAANPNLQKNKDKPASRQDAAPAAPAANASKAKAPQEKVGAAPTANKPTAQRNLESVKKGQPEKTPQTKAPDNRSKQDIRNAQRAQKKAEKQAKEDKEKAAKLAKEKAERQAKEAKALKSKQTSEARKIAEQEAKAREKNNMQPPATELHASPNAAPDSKEKRLLELLQLYQQDKISPREYQNRRSKIIEEK